MDRITKARFDAALFDLDGVLSDTDKLHSVCWKKLFDGFLEGRDEPFQAFSDEDYLLYVDGRPRYDGVRDFLASRDIALPQGTPGDPPGDGTVCALGNKKDEMINELFAARGVDVYEDAVVLVRRLKAEGIKIGVVSSSKQCATVLEMTGIAGLFDTRVDGVTIEELNIAGKPAPDAFLLGAERLGAAPDRTAVFEDAISGVEAGVAGKFALVIGVARKGNDDALAEAGAHLVVHVLSELPE